MSQMFLNPWFYLFHYEERFDNDGGIGHMAMLVA